MSQDSLPSHNDAVQYSGPVAGHDRNRQRRHRVRDDSPPASMVGFPTLPGPHTTRLAASGRTNSPDCADTTRHVRPSKRNDGGQRRGRHLPRTVVLVRAPLPLPPRVLVPVVVRPTHGATPPPLSRAATGPQCVRR